MSLPDVEQYISIENYGKVLGAHKTFDPQGEVTRVVAGSGGGVAEPRSGGAANLIEISYSSANYRNPGAGAVRAFFTHEFEATTDSKNYRYYVQCEGIVTVAQLYIIAEVVNSYDDDSEYTMTTQQSDEAFTARADANDWAEYMEVTGIQPAVASKVRIKCYCSFYHATQNIYIDPMVVIS